MEIKVFYVSRFYLFPTKTNRKQNVNIDYRWKGRKRQTRCVSCKRWHLLLFLFCRFPHCLAIALFSKTVSVYNICDVQQFRFNYNLYLISLLRDSSDIYMIAIRLLSQYHLTHVHGDFLTASSSGRCTTFVCELLTFSFTKVIGAVYTWKRWRSSRSRSDTIVAKRYDDRWKRFNRLKETETLESIA